MKKYNNLMFLFAVGLILNSTAFPEIVQNGASTTKNKLNKNSGNAYLLNVNNLQMPMSSDGVMANVDIVDNQGKTITSGNYGGKKFLFSGGFFLSGKSPNSKDVWANAVASASRIQDYEVGTKKYPKTDPKSGFYVVKRSDGDFAQSWKDWADAVEQGAYFYDGNGNGVYDPNDDNHNGKWDPTEDRPDLLGDVTVWCAYNDNIEPAKRTFTTVDRQGIEIRQTVFGYASDGLLGNILFLRYNILNTGMKADVLDSCYFGVWADPDLGSEKDDLVGCDTVRNAGYTYNDGADDVYGNNAPCFMIDFFQGPFAYIPGVTFKDNNNDGRYTEGIDDAITTAHNKLGPINEANPDKKYLQKLYLYDKMRTSLADTVIEVPAEVKGAKAMGISSFVQYIQSDPKLGDPKDQFEARHYMLGNDKLNGKIDPCKWYLSKNDFINCSKVNSKTWYSGDPVTQTGWINTYPTDVRQMTNTGPFQLVRGVPINIVVAYIVGRSNKNSVESITEARKVDDFSQTIYDQNFKAPTPPPAPKVSVSSGDKHIDLVWDCQEQASYNAQTIVNGIKLVDAKTKGFNVYAFRSNNTSEVVNNVQNKFMIQNFKVNDKIKDLYVSNPTTGGQELLLSSTNSITFTEASFNNPNTSRIRLRLDKDPITGGPIVKGKKYYFAVTAYALNELNVKSKNYRRSNGLPYLSVDADAPADDYFLDSKGDSSLAGKLENSYTIFEVEAGKDSYNYTGSKFSYLNRTSGSSYGGVQFDVIYSDSLRNSKYKVVFSVDSTSKLYDPKWTLVRDNKDTLISQSNYFSYGADSVNYKVIDGFITRAKYFTPTMDDFTYSSKSGNTPWYYNKKDNFAVRRIGNVYLGADVSLPTTTEMVNIPKLQYNYSSYMKFSKARKVELRFSNENIGMAYRYVNGVFGTINRKNFTVYAGAIHYPADTAKSGAIGGIDASTGTAKGFVPVPFTAWVVDSIYKEERQLAVGFIEKSKVDGGYPDGVWNPKDSILKTGEYIVIFDRPYDPNGNQAELSVIKDGTKDYYAELSGLWLDRVSQTSVPKTLPNTITTLNDIQKAIANSPYLAGMYAVGIEIPQNSSLANIKLGDKLIIPISKYPYRTGETYEIGLSDKGKLPVSTRKSLFEKVNVVPNPLYAFNGNNIGNADEPYVTFTNLPSNENYTIKIYSISGMLIRELNISNSVGTTYPWDLKNEDNLRVASGMYIAVIHSPNYGDRVLKFAIIMPQKQIKQY